MSHQAHLIERQHTRVSWEWGSGAVSAPAKGPTKLSLCQPDREGKEWPPVVLLGNWRSFISSE